MKALIIIDVQNDFLPGGALAVPKGDAVISVINAVTASGFFDVIVATQDWHPPDHLSFASQHKGKKTGDVIKLEGLNQVLWPDHCVQHTKGAEFASSLDCSRVEKFFQKGTDPKIDSYSAFFDNAHRRSTGLEDYLKDRGVEDVYLAGLATDYCVKYSALDACLCGFNVWVIEEGTRGINLNRGDVAVAWEEMEKHGARRISEMAFSAH